VTTPARVLPFDGTDARGQRRPRRPKATACRVAPREVAATVRDEVRREALADALAHALAQEIRDKLGATGTTAAGTNRGDDEC
jgi:hypothetical protein